MAMAMLVLGTARPDLLMEAVSFIRVSVAGDIAMLIPSTINIMLIPVVRRNGIPIWTNGFARRIMIRINGIPPDFHIE
jgi:hypothetical protein